MIKWVDIVSPQLRVIHQEWIRLRDIQLMPDVRTYNQFALSSLIEDQARQSTCVLVPGDSSPVIKHIGERLKPMLPSCAAGHRFSDITSPAIHSFFATAHQRIVVSRQPEARRGTQAGGRKFEALLLPFGDGGFRVCLVHAIYDLGDIDWRGQFK